MAKKFNPGFDEERLHMRYDVTIDKELITKLLFLLSGFPRDFPDSVWKI